MTEPKLAEKTLDERKLELEEQKFRLDERKFALEELKARIDRTRDRWEMNFKGVNLLLIAHAATLLACLSVLKDYSTVTHYKGIGFLIQIEALGLATAMLTFIFFIGLRVVQLQKIVTRRRPPPDNLTILEKLMSAVVWGENLIVVLGATIGAVSIGCLVLILFRGSFLLSSL